MKNQVFKIILLLIISLTAKADVKILQIIPASGNACTGTIKLELIAPYVKPFTIKRDGVVLISNYQGDYYDITDVCVGQYKIEIEGNISCAVWEFNVTVTGCASNIQVTEVLTQNCGTSNSKNGSIYLTVSGGTEPYQYSWTSDNGYKATWKNIVGLAKGAYTILIKDNSGCTFTKTYQINNATNPTFTTSLSTPVCYSQRIVNFNVTPTNTTYRYSWSDGINVIEKNSTTPPPPKIYQRVLYLTRPKTTFKVTVTNTETNCSTVRTIFDEEPKSCKASLNRKIDPFNNPEFNNGIVTIHTDGEVLPFAGTLNIGVYRNGTYIRTDAFPTKNPNGTNVRFFSILNLSEGGYEFKLWDGGLCELSNSVFAILKDCTSGVTAPKIQIIKYSLPPYTPNAFVQASLSYNGDKSKCTFRWATNEHYKITTNSLIISGQDLKNLDHSGATHITVTAFCPCGEAEDKVAIDPCGGNQGTVVDFKAIRVEPLCYGFLPTGKIIEKKTSTTLEIDIDVASYAIGPLGLEEYNKRIADIKWTDGTQPSIKSYNKVTQILTVSRVITLEGIYGLTVTTAFGCNKTGRIEVKNDFNSFQPDPNEFPDRSCSWLTWCGEEPSVSYRKDWNNWVSDGRIQLINLDECEFEIKCGPSGTPRTIFGMKHELRLGGTPCKKRIICDLSKITLPRFTLGKPLPDGYIELQPTNNYEIEPNYIPYYAYFKDIDFQCCTAWNGPGGTPNKNTFLPLTQNNWHIFPDLDGIYIQSGSIPSNPCMALKYCTDGLAYIEIGSLIEDKICKNFGNNNCERCFRCQYGNVILDEQCLPTPTLDCPNCLKNFQSRSLSKREEFAISHTLDLLLIKAIKTSKVKTYPIIEIFSADGKLLLNKQLQFSDSKTEENINISNLPNSFYIARLNIDGIDFQFYSFIKYL